MTRALFVCALAGLQPFSAARGEETVQIAVRIFKAGGIPAATLARGEQEAAKVMRRAGVEVTWVECLAASCTGYAPLDEYWVNVGTWKPSVASARDLGFATFNGTTKAPAGGVYYPMVQHMAQTYNLDEASILGAVLAHELGHLLGLNHALAGVMSPHYDRSRMVDMSLGALLFSSQEAKRMRSDVMRRQSALAAASAAQNGGGPVSPQSATVPVPLRTVR